MTYPAQPPYGQPAPQQYAPQQTAQAPAPQAAPAFNPQPVPTFRAAPNPSATPRQPDFRGRLVLILPQSIGTTPSKLKPGEQSQYVSADVIVLEGGPVASTDTSTPGRLYDGHEFKGVWLSGVRVFPQLQGLVGSGQYVLGRINTQKGSGDAAKGNAWGIETEFTPQDADIATRYLNGDRSFVVPAGSVPQGPAPAPQQYAAPAPAPQQYAAPAPAPQQYAAPAPAQGQPNPWAPTGQPLHQGGNPFAQ